MKQLPAEQLLKWTYPENPSNRTAVLYQKISLQKVKTRKNQPQQRQKSNKDRLSQDAGILVDWDMESFCPPHLQDAPLVTEIEVEQGNPFLYGKDGMLIQRAGADFNFEYTIDSETRIPYVHSKKDEIRIPEGIQAHKK